MSSGSRATATCSPRCSRRRSRRSTSSTGSTRVAEAVVGAFEPRIQYALHNQSTTRPSCRSGSRASGKSVVYQVLEVEGPPHDRTFTAAALLEGEEVGVGRGRSKKDAEQEAAKEALGRPELRGAGEATS